MSKKFTLLLLVTFGCATWTTIELFGQPDTAPGAKTQSGECMADENAILDLRKKQEELADQKQKLDEKEKDLQSRETALSEEIKKLEDLKKEILLTETNLNSKQEERVAKLVEAFEKMSQNQLRK